MKKLFIIMLSALFIFSCAVTASAEEVYNNAGELYEAWADHLPDYICGVWSTDGGTINLTFGVLNNEVGNAGRQKMLDLIKDDTTITFVYQKYSRNYLLQIQREIGAYMQLDLGLISTGVYDTRNCVALGILEDKKDDARTKAMIREITEKYGDAVAVEYTGEIVPTVRNETGLANRASARFLFAALAAVLVLCAVFVVSQKSVFHFQTGNGTTVSRSVPTSKEVEAMVRKSSYQTSSDLDQRIMDAINEKK